MFYGIGVKVRMKHTGDAGIVREWLDGGMLMVELLDGMQIPTFEEDVVREEAWEGLVEKKKKPKAEEVSKESPSLQSFTQYMVLKSVGIQLVFEEVRRYEDITHYNIHLINDTNFDVLFEFDFFTQQEDLIVLDGKLDKMCRLKVGEMQYDVLNDHPEVQFTCWQLSTAGKSAELYKDLKIKAKAFFNNRITVPFLDKEAHHFILISDFEAKPVRQDAEDLKTYTKRTAKPITETRKIMRSRHEVSEMAHFSAEIDLHIENLTQEYKHLSNGDILKIQLRSFDAFMDKSLRLGVDRIFVIHGLGKGTLKDSIHTRLINEYRIKTFRNEYHPRYGWGATEIEF